MIANFISFIRMLLGVALFFATAKQKLLLIFIAGWSDFLDGYIARKFNQFTPVGAWMDPLADKVFITCLYISLVLENVIPLWVFGLFLGRDILISAGYIFMRYRMMFDNFRPNFVSKVNTGLQMLYPMAVISEWYPAFFMYAAIITTILSTIAYAFRFFLAFWLCKVRVPTFE